MTTVLACPVCGAELTIGASAATCPKAHTFDLARSGYLNLLLSNKKQSAQPGDSPAMLLSRRMFLRGGFYDQMSSEANVAVGRILADRHDGRPVQVADVGCGEGYFTARLKNGLAPAATYYGVDVSRAGIRMATSYDRAIHWVVASLHRSPFLPLSLDVVLAMFAPIDAPDARRIVRNDGALVTVTPGPDHLDGLRGILYTTVMPHPDTPALMAGDTLFERTASTRVRYPVVLDSREQIMNLLTMTPYYWNISPATRTRVEGVSRLELTVDAYVSVFRPLS